MKEKANIYDLQQPTTTTQLQILDFRQANIECGRVNMFVSAQPSLNLKLVCQHQHYMRAIKPKGPNTCFFKNIFASEYLKKLTLTS